MGMTAAAGNLRTIWISIRAMNYTQRVFNDIIGSVNTTIKGEMNMVTQTKNMSNEAMHFVAAGTLMLTLAGMIGLQLFNLASSSQQGAAAMANLKMNITLAQQSLANAAFQVLQASFALAALNAILNLINSNPFFAQLVMWVAVIVAGLLAFAGIAFILDGALIALTVTLPTLIIGFIGVNTAATISCAVFNALGISVTRLVVAMAPILIAVIVFEELQGVLGTIPALIVAITIAVVGLALVLGGAAFLMNILTGGASAAAAAETWGASAAWAAAATAAGFQMGTRGLPYTGMFFGHKGEVVYNPATNRPTQVGADLGGGVGEVNTYHMPITIENLHTKSDFDDVNEKMRIALRERMRGRK